MVSMVVDLVLVCGIVVLVCPAGQERRVDEACCWAKDMSGVEEVVRNFAEEIVDNFVVVGLLRSSEAGVCRDTLGLLSCLAALLPEELHQGEQEVVGSPSCPAPFAPRASLVLVDTDTTGRTSHLPHHASELPFVTGQDRRVYPDALPAQT